VVILPRSNSVLISGQFILHQGHAKQRKKKCHKRNPDIHLNKRAHSRLDTCFLEEGSVQDKKTSWQSSVLTAERLEDVWLWLQKSPRNSLRKPATQVRMLSSTTQTAFRKLHQHPYCNRAVQELKYTVTAEQLTVLHIVLVFL
jgi:hypothetical protein